ncbi:uncharacterized protein METZ01_LOCUS222351, partial [marine metagenome]
IKNKDDIDIKRAQAAIGRALNRLNISKR